MADAASNDGVDGTEEVIRWDHVPMGSTMSSTLAQRLANVGLTPEGATTPAAEADGTRLAFQTDEATAPSADASPER